MFLRIVLILLVLCSVETEGKKSPSKLLDQLLSDYIRSDPPSMTKSTEVKIGAYFNSINEIDTKNMLVSSTIYLRQQWTDPRLAFDKNELDGDSSCVLPVGSWEKIWIPDIFFRNQIKRELFESNQENVLVKLNASGSVWFVSHISLDTKCPMKLQKFPFDTQVCPIIFESFKYTMDTLHFNWLSSPVDVDSGLQLPMFTLTEIDKNDCSMNYSSGSFPCLEMNFHFRRDLGSYVLQFFIPTILSVIISWFSFWMNAEKYSHKMQFLLILILILLIQYAIADSKVPAVSYTKAMDIWMTLCLLFVLLAMLEATFVKTVGMKLAKSKEGSDDADVAMCMGKVYSPNEVSRIIDIACRIIFPVVFLLVIIIYFSLYTS